MAKLTWSITIQVTGAPTMTAAAAEQTVEATDHVSVQIAPGDADKVVEIQPGAATGIQLLVVQANTYSAENPISFVASDGSTDSAAITLNGPQVFTASGVALFAVDPPTQLKFTNPAAGAAAEVEVFVARDATP